MLGRGPDGLHRHHSNRRCQGTRGSEDVRRNAIHNAATRAHPIHPGPRLARDTDAAIGFTLGVSGALGASRGRAEHLGCTRMCAAPLPRPELPSVDGDGLKPADAVPRETARDRRGLPGTPAPPDRAAGASYRWCRSAPASAVRGRGVRPRRLGDRVAVKDQVPYDQSSIGLSGVQRRRSAAPVTADATDPEATATSARSLAPARLQAHARQDTHPTSPRFRAAVPTNSGPTDPRTPQAYRSLAVHTPCNANA